MKAFFGRLVNVYYFVITIKDSNSNSTEYTTENTFSLHYPAFTLKLECIWEAIVQLVIGWINI